MVEFSKTLCQILTVVLCVPFVSLGITLLVRGRE